MPKRTCTFSSTPHNHIVFFMCLFVYINMKLLLFIVFSYLLYTLNKIIKC